MDDHRPNKYEESGIPIYYTVEKKRGTDNVRMTYRAFKEVAKSGAPEYGRILHEESHKVADGVEPLDTRIHATLQKYQSDFWAKAFKKAAVVNDIAKQFSSEKGLPLIVVWSVHRKKITSNLTDKERAFKQLVKEGFGGTPIGAFTSSVLGPIFSSYSNRDYQAVISFLRELQRLEQEQQRLSNCPLAHYRLWGSIGKIKSSTYIRRDISLSAIPKQQTRSIVRSLVDDLEAKTNAGQSGKFEMGALLVLTTGVPAEEVCTPKQGNVIFPPQPYFPAHFHVSGKCKKSGKKTFLLPYPEKLPTILSPAKTRLSSVIIICSNTSLPFALSISMMITLRRMQLRVRRIPRRMRLDTQNTADSSGIYFPVLSAVLSRSIASFTARKIKAFVDSPFEAACS